MFVSVSVSISILVPVLLTLIYKTQDKNNYSMLLWNQKPLRAILRASSQFLIIFTSELLSVELVTNLYDYTKQLYIPNANAFALHIKYAEHKTGTTIYILHKNI